VDRTSRPLASSMITRVEPPLGITIPCPPEGSFSSIPEYAATSRKFATIAGQEYAYLCNSKSSFEPFCSNA
jgi:hypothetical protein